VSLQVTRIGDRQSAEHQGRDQESLDDMRRNIARDMVTYMSKLASLNTPGVEAGDAIVRECSLHGFDYFSLEQTVSLAIHPSGEGWIGMSAPGTLGDELWPCTNQPRRRMAR
jgi:hypothetical protein